MAKSRDIEIMVVIDGEMKLFLSPTTEMGSQILKRIASGDYQLTPLSGIIPGVGKIPENSLMIEKRKDKVDDTEEDDNQ